MSQPLQASLNSLTCQEIVALAATNTQVRRVMMHNRDPKVYVCMRAAEMLAQLRNADGSPRMVAHSSAELKKWKKILRAFVEPVVHQVLLHFAPNDHIRKEHLFVVALYMHHHWDEPLVQFTVNFRRRDKAIRKKLFTQPEQRPLWRQQLQDLKRERVDNGADDMTRRVWAEWGKPASFQPAVVAPPGIPRAGGGIIFTRFAVEKIMDVIQTKMTPDERSMLRLAAYMFQSNRADELNRVRRNL
jgi:hypothetical protein